MVALKKMPRAELRKPRCFCSADLYLEIKCIVMQNYAEDLLNKCEISIIIWMPNLENDKKYCK
jgi:hypothetical protein